jgi:hemerythrin-like domain-containing protein
MPVTIGAKPESDFDDPLGLMTDCHRRIERFLETLKVVAENAAGRELSDEEGNAVETALLYFRESGPRHTADEEDSLFPRMRVAPSCDVISMLAQLSALNADHERVTVLHTSVESIFGRWRTASKLTSKDAQQLRADLRTLCQIYKKHIAVEESVVFPLARRILNSATQLAMGEEMRCRRGLSAPSALAATSRKGPARAGETSVAAIAAQAQH